MSQTHVAVIGAGMAGLTTAWLLADDPRLRVTLLEASSGVGGKVVVSDFDDVPIDEGAESLLATRPEAVALARAVGLGSDLVEPQARSASVWTRGTMRPLPPHLLMGVPTDLRSLARAQVLSLPALLRLPLDHLAPAPALVDDVAVGPYVASRLGREVVERLVDPLLGGVYAGSADALSLEATIPALFREIRRDGRSLLAAARHTMQAASDARGPSGGPVFLGIAGGVGRLPEAVAAQARSRGVVIELSRTVRRVERTAAGFVVTAGATRSPYRISADAVVVATPAAPAARLLVDVAPAAAAELAAIESASVALVTLVYRASDVAPRAGSGFLVPPVDARAVKAATYVSDKWGWVGDRLGADRVVLRASLGRHGEESLLQRDDSDLALLAHEDLVAAVGISALPLRWRVSRWGGGLPQYAVGHRARVRRIRADVASVPGLAVAGAAYDGVGIPAVIGSAHDAVASLREHLEVRAGRAVGETGHHG